MAMTTRCYPREVVRRAFAARLLPADEDAYVRRLDDGTGPEHKDSGGDVSAHIAMSFSRAELYVNVEMMSGCIIMLDVCDKAVECASALPSPHVWLWSACDR